MNPLDSLKDKLRIKPIVDEFKPINVIPSTYVAPNTPEKIKLSKVTVADKRDTQFDIKELIKRLEDKKLSKITIKSTVKMAPTPSATRVQMFQEAPKELEPEQEQEQLEQEQTKKKVKKSAKKIKLIIEELEEGEEEGKELGEEAEKRVLEQEEKQEKPKGRRTKKHIKGISILAPEEWVDIDNKSVIARLPPKEQKVNIKVSSYFMNNREKFINFINSVFEPYRDEVLDDKTQITCESLGQDSGDFKLLTHQKLVRDYLNLYTPYRGLLLYFGLGTGKTCTSIAIAEGLKNSKKVIVMTPASLRRNFMEELKKCGDPLYKKNQFWQWISVKEHPEAMDTLSSILNLSVEYITKNKGAWLVNYTKPSNYDTLDQTQLKSLNDQIDEMIQAKYKFINYNGLRRDKLKEMTNNFETNIFDDSVIIIDEAHNFVSRIVNKIAKEKEIPVDKKGKKDHVPYAMALVLYEFLLSAQNARVVLLTGSPYINNPNELAILFNILRGYIKSWEIPLDITSGQPVTKEKLQDIFMKEKVLDYFEYSAASKKLTVTRNPFGFENKIKQDSGYHGVTNKPKEIREPSGKIVQQNVGEINDNDFERRVISILNNNGIQVFPTGIKIELFKALPDKLDDFINWYIEPSTGNIKNAELFKRRIMGLTSYFRSQQEGLLPKYDKLTDYHVVKIPMSDYQFTVYEAARQQERKQEKDSKKKKGVPDVNGIYKDPSSTYRIFSRLYCNYVMPKEIGGRPLPIEDREKAQGDQLEEIYGDVLKETAKKGSNDLDGDDWSGEQEGDQIIEKIADKTYEKRIQTALQLLKEHAGEYLSPEGLKTYGPKFLHMLENIQDAEHRGLHLVYSQFRSLEGIGIFKMVLEQNGFTQFKIKKDPSGTWNLDISEEDMGKPTFALYTGTESSEEKEIIRNIYNGDWDLKSPITAQLKEIANNNDMGEIIKVLMITSSGSEGINLRNTRYVHLTEPYWHPVRSQQVIGRARRICSHKNLPEALQTVEVFVYLMSFTPEQIKSDASIELKRKDLSKRKYKIRPDKEDVDNIPLTSDECLFEISTIKEELSEKFLTAIKEASIDCAIYSKQGSKEQLHCLSFGQPSANKFAYNPNISKDEIDVTAKMNKNKIEWRGVETTIRGKTYISRQVNKDLYNLYDMDTYKQALEDPRIEPMLVATIETNQRGEQVLKKV